MSFMFHKIASSRADATALVAEDKYLPGQVKNFLRDLIMSRAEGALEVEADGHVEGDYFHMGRVIVKGMVFDVPSPVVPPPESTSVLVATASTVPASSAPVVPEPTVIPVPDLVVAPPSAPAPEAPVTVTVPVVPATDPLGGTPVVLSENPADHT